MIYIGLYYKLIVSLVSFDQTSCCRLHDFFFDWLSFNTK